MTQANRLPTPTDQTFDADIITLGAQGDGIAEHNGARLFVPYTVAGDRVRLRRTAADRAEPLEWLKYGPFRAEPPCPHFGPGKCGGCLLQHLADDTYVAWKTGMLAETLARAGISGFDMRPLARTPAGGRRRAEFAAHLSRNAALVGFHARNSHEIIPIDPCPVLQPQLEALLAPLREFLADAVRGPMDVDILATRVGDAIELLFTGPAPDTKLRQALAEFAQRANLARIAWRTEKRRSPDIIAQRRPLQTKFGQVAVDLPPGAFLQASEAGERAIVAAVAEAIGSARRVADLYAGAGAIALAITGGKRSVHAIERDGEMVAALDAAARRTRLGGQLQTQVRDLVRRPLVGDELADFDAVVFDPPREGADSQVRALAAARVKVVVGVSCNPATFARDAKTLIDAGYKMTTVTPVDQFLWSPHLELVGEFRR